MVWYGPFSQGVVRFYYNNEKNIFNYNIFIKDILKKTTVILLGISLILFIVLIPFGSTFNPLLALFSGIFILAFKNSEFSNELLNVVRLRKENALLQLIEKALIALAIFIVWKFSNLNLLQVLAYSIVAYSIFFLLKFRIFTLIHSAKNINAVMASAVMPFSKVII